METPSAARHHVKRSARRENLAQTRDDGHGLAHGPVSFDVAMQTGFRNLRHRNRNGPGIGFICHVAHSTYCATPTRAGEANLHDPRCIAASLTPSRLAIAASA